MGWTPVDHCISQDEKLALLELCTASRTTESSEQEAKILEAQRQASYCDTSTFPVLTTLRSLRHHDVSRGAFIIRGLPTVPDPILLLAIVGCVAGTVHKYPGEGDYVIEIKEQALTHKDRPSFRNSREFFLHTDLSYEPSPPDVLIMHSLYNDPAEGGYSTLCDVHTVLPSLMSSTVEELSKSQFIFPSPSHYQGSAELHMPILSKNRNNTWQIRFRRDSLRARTYAGICALVDFIAACQLHAFETSLEPNSVIVIDNRRVLHGRTAFVRSRDTIYPRHLNRLYCTLEELRV